MKIKRAKYLNRIFRIISASTLLFCFLKEASGQIIDQQHTANYYYGNDSQWYMDNIPFFECSDPKIQEVYYYRWQLYKAHIRDIGSNRYVITEFLDDVGWDKEPYSSLNDATGFHIYEGRWLKDCRYVKGYIDYMYAGGGNDRHFSEAIAEAAWANYLVDADSVFITNQLGIMQHIFNLWLDHYDLDKNLYFIEPLLDATEYTISSIDASGGKEGFFGGQSFRPTINSYMYANALAIAQIALLKGNAQLSRKYREIASNIKLTFQNNLWNDSLQYFVDRYKVNNQFVRYWDFIRGRELAGIVPWCYNLPDNSSKFNVAWETLLDTTKLLGKYGLRTVEPSYQYYMKQYRYLRDNFECQWNGPSWPYQTTQALVAMANLLNNYSQNIVSVSDYLNLLRLYTQQHYLSNNKLDLQEDYNPDTGAPIVGLPRSHHYNHSDYNDLIITGLCGIRPSNGNVLIINPLIDNSIQYFCLENVIYHGHNLTIAYDKDGTKYMTGKGLSVYLDGQKASLKENNGKYEIIVGAPKICKTEKIDDLALKIFKNCNPVPSASINSIPDSLYQAIDGRCWYFKEIKNWWSTYGSNSKSNWYALDFGKIVNVSSVVINFYAADNMYNAPTDYKVEYWKENKWAELQNVIKKPDIPIGNGPNAVKFDTIKTSGIRIVFDNEKNFVAISEIKAY